MTAHSKAPWRIVEHRMGENEAWSEDPAYERAILDADNVKIAVCEKWIGEKWANEAEANALLMVAAPETALKLAQANDALQARNAFAKRIERKLAETAAQRDYLLAYMAELGRGKLTRAAMIDFARAAIARAEGASSQAPLADERERRAQ